MGNARAREGRFLEAEEHYVAALRIRAGFVEAGRREGASSKAAGKPANALVLRRDLA
jgi:hypothetical protein